MCKIYRDRKIDRWREREREMLRGEGETDVYKWIEIDVVI